MKNKFLLLAAFAALLMSCTSDNTNAEGGDTITHFIESRSTLVPGAPEYSTVIDYTVSDNKYDSYTRETFENDVSTGVINATDFNYTDGLLVSQTDAGGVRHFFYDTAGRLVGADRLYVNGNSLYYRFVHQPGNVVFCERLNAPYNDAAAAISYRKILDFDANDDIVAAGSDANLDGIPEQQNVFTMSDGDVTGIVFADGTQVAYSYSNIVDNQHFLAENSFGKQVTRLMCSEALSSNSAEQIVDILNSRHVLENQVPLAEYILNQSNNFIKKKTTTNPVSGGESVVVTEYFF